MTVFYCFALQKRWTLLKHLTGSSSRFTWLSSSKCVSQECKGLANRNTDTYRTSVVHSFSFILSSSYLQEVTYITHQGSGAGSGLGSCHLTSKLLQLTPGWCSCIYHQSAVCSSSRMQKPSWSSTCPSPQTLYHSPHPALCSGGCWYLSTMM